MWEIIDSDLCFDGEAVVKNARSVFKCDNLENGTILTLTSNEAKSENIYSFGSILNINRFMSCLRENHIFLSVHFGNEISAIRPETFCLLVEKKDNRYLLLLPVYDDNSRGTLQYGNNELQVVGFTGSENHKVSIGKLIYISEGDNPYKMMDNAAKDLKNVIHGFNLRQEKNLPDYLNYLGWCTWNAFYYDVNEEKYLSGLEEFKKNGVQLGSTIIDDGWLSTDDVEPIGARILKKFEENRKKFPSGFSSLSKKAKTEYGITDFIVWHASMGYWGGNGIEEFFDKPTKINYPSVFSAFAEDMNKNFLHYPIKPQKAEDFYDEFYKYLKSVGVDGVKIDVQYLIEAVEEYVGNRIKSFDTYHFAKEKAINKYFGGNALNCMSCSNDMVYRMKYSNALRTGADYNPDVNNGFLIVSNAYNTFWLSPITYTDWDMFFSNKDDSYMEAIGRVVGGSPIYISDELGEHNFKLLKELSLPDGRVLRPLNPGRPTLDCLMEDPMEKENVLKIFNKNFCTYILGVFNFHNMDLQVLCSPMDVEEISGDEFIVFSFLNSELKKVSLSEKINFNIDGKIADLITFSPIIDGVAVIGLKNKINSSAAVKEVTVLDDNIDITVISKGEYCLYSEIEPKKLRVNGKEVSFVLNNNIIEFSFEE